MLKAHELGGNAAAFIQSQLSYGRSLAKKLAPLPFGEGRTVAILPPSVAPQALTDFQSGDVATGEEVHKLANLIRGYLIGHTNRICVLEHPVLRVGDTREPPADYFTVGEDVYVYVTSQSDHGAIVAAARETHGYPSIGALTGVGDEHPLPNPASAQPEALLDELATHVNAVIVGAYDNESWIVWLKPSFEEEAGEIESLA